ncbi:efflux RND transporter periplasmic adaptor subunit [Verrucomicrobiota bacterium]
MKTRSTTGVLKKVLAAAVLLAVFAAGFVVRGCLAPKPRHLTPAASDSAPAATWTCSMHPQIKLPKPGKCPICFMDLIPQESGGEDETGLRELSVSENAAKLMEIETVPVERRFVTAAVRMVGKVDYDETRVSSITAWVPGRLDRLFVDYTGVSVKKGDHMVQLYSPELLSAQEELLQAINAARSSVPSDAGIARETTTATVEAAREKLRLWGLTPDQIAGIETRGKPDEQVTIYAPAGGIVVEKKAQEGMYVDTGTRIYTIADLARVWVNLDAYESDLAWLRYGQQVQFTTESHPGEAFTGSISFIHPVLDERTRTVKVRVNVPNEDGRLKPGMFVRAVAQAQIATGGRVMDAALAGKWISPMHPEIVKDGPGNCDVCGMPLVRAESLGYVGGEPTAEDMPLAIPDSAPLLTGKRAIVYVEVQGKDRPTFEGREIVLGPRGSNYYVVREGLKEGDRVVTKGAFKIDAELQIRAKPSMMMPQDGGRKAEGEEQTAEGRPQTHCPVMGGAINKEVYVDYKGQRVYFCCPGCETSFLKEPEKHLEQMRSAGVEPERLE